MERQPRAESLDTYLMHGRSLNDWHAFLTTDHRTGESTAHLACPVSRYGYTADSNAWYAVAAEVAYVEVCGEDDDAEIALDFLMGLAVNDHADIAGLVVEYWYALPLTLQEMLGSEEEVRELNQGGAT